MHNEEEFNELEAAEDHVEAPKKRKRGFATLSPERVREIASAGGKAAHAAGTAHQWSADEARAAGRAGGKASRRPRAPKAET